MFCLKMLIFHILYLGQRVMHPPDTVHKQEYHVNQKPKLVIFTDSEAQVKMKILGFLQ